MGLKNLLKEFKEFAIRGNVVDMAVGVVIGAAFGKVVTSVVEIFLNPILEALPKTAEGGIGFTGSLIAFGGILVEFILTALILFAIIKAINTAKSKTKKKEAPKPEAPTTKECPFCLSEIPVKATRCAHCTSQLDK